MGILSLFEVASMPILQIMFISGLGAFMATGYCNLLPPDARRYINKIVFVAFTPCLTFASLAKTVTFADIISWWFMPLNIGLTFLFGGILGWIAVKILKPDKYLQGLIIAVCSTGNMGNLMLIIIPAICTEKGSPFRRGGQDACRSIGLSYASFSMAVGGFYIWTCTYHLIRSSATGYKAAMLQEPNKELHASDKTHLHNTEEQGDSSVLMSLLPPSKGYEVDTQDQSSVYTAIKEKEQKGWFMICKRLENLHQMIEELLSPPTLGAIFGFLFGSVTWLKGLIIGEGAPLHVIQDTVQLLGDGTIPCITLILGGNLTQGLKTGRLKPQMIMGVLIVRYFLLPIIGAAVVKLAGHLGFLPQDPLYHFVLMVQYTVPPAMSIGTITQLYDVGQDECSVLYLWTYLVAAFAVSFWATIFMWILS